MAKKARLDQLLLIRGLAESRRQAQGLIMSGKVLVEDSPVEKAGAQVDPDAAIRLRGAPSRYVGRGGEKIEPALAHFRIEIRDRVAADIGASTGGFTDCLLQQGARLVYAVDVGHNQLHPKLRDDNRVVVMERTHARDLESSRFNPRPDLAVIDVSFIGVRKILEPVASILADKSQLLVLVKPQFELEPEHISSGGVVRDESLRKEAIAAVARQAELLGLCSHGSFTCPVLGSKKRNQEYFLLLEKGS